MSTIREQIVAAAVLALATGAPTGVPAPVRTRLDSPSADQLPALYRRLGAAVGLVGVGPNDYGHPTDAALRLVRDLAARRKPPLTLVRRGLVLLREEPAVVAGHVAAGARAASPRTVERLLVSTAQRSR